MCRKVGRIEGLLGVQIRVRRFIGLVKIQIPGTCLIMSRGLGGQHHPFAKFAGFVIASEGRKC